MKNVFVMLIMLIANLAFSQQVVYWKGGTPGQENNWHEAKNWSNNKIPDEFSHVIISPKNADQCPQPIINDFVEVNRIDIYSRANLTINNTGEIYIDGSYSYTKGIINHGGFIFNKGVISLYDVDGFSYLDFQEMLIVQGEIYYNDISMTAIAANYER